MSAPPPPLPPHLYLCRVDAKITEMGELVAGGGGCDRTREVRGGKAEIHEIPTLLILVPALQLHPDNRTLPPIMLVLDTATICCPNTVFGKGGQKTQ